MTVPSSFSDHPEPDRTIAFQAIDDAADPSALRGILREYWPAYRAWMRRAPRVDPARCRRLLAEHMPDLAGTFDELCECLGDGPDASRFLSLWRPPPLVRGCTQLVLEDGSGPVLLRSYDHHPRLFDALILKAAWSGTPTLCLTDCVWGSLDGMNDSGLAIALAFGGDRAVGDGFAAPLLCRYVLQTCRTVEDARSALARLPVYMPYTFVVVDAAGEFTAAYLRPDREPIFVARRATANHQGTVEWPDYARFSESEARLAAAECLIGQTQGLDTARRSFLQAPLWRTDYARASGTLYIAEYAVSARRLTLHWPERSERFELAGFEPRRFEIELPAPDAIAGGSGPSTRA